MTDKPTPDITPNLAISAYHVLQQYCFRGMPCDWNLNEEGEINETEKGNTN